MLNHVVDLWSMTADYVHLLALLKLTACFMQPGICTGHAAKLQLKD